MSIRELRELPKVGDTVRVTIEGVVTDSDSTMLQIRITHSPRVGERTYHNFRYATPEVKSVEVIKKFRKIGDLINRNEIMAWEPRAGTVIVQDDNDITWMKIDRGMAQWVNSIGTYAEPSAMPHGDYSIVAIA